MPVFPWLFLALALLMPSAAGAASGCGEPATAIAQVQGHGKQSPHTGKILTVEGVLTLDARGKGGFGGFYLQQADLEADQNANTSEALFVHTRHKAGTVGDRLRVTGRVKEYHGLTELTNIRNINVCGQAPLPTPIVVSLPWRQPPEALENMRVAFQQPLTVIDNYTLARFGELTLAAQDQVVPTELQASVTAARRLAEQNRRDRVVLDDVRSQRAPLPVPWPTGGLRPDNTVRAGDQVSQLRGVLDFRFGQWRLQPDAQPLFQASNPRPAPPPRPTSEHLRVMTLNLGNYFNGDGKGQGFPAPRGADSVNQYQAQHRRLLDALQAPDPDVLALMEMENDGTDSNSAIAELTRALGTPWRFISGTGKPGQDDIRSVLLYRADRVEAIGAPTQLPRGTFQALGRLPLAQTFRPLGSQQGVRIVAVHFKSKSCRGASGDNLDRGEGCFAKRRIDAAGALVNWLQDLHEPVPFAGTLVTGDLNSYARETPLAIFRKAGFMSMVHRFHPCTSDHCPHYSYRYKGEKGSLDYALASKSLQPRILDARTWLINADEPQALGYQALSPTTPTADASTGFPWRSSDHNPVITDIRL